MKKPHIIITAPIPAGQSKPVKIPPGQKKISVENNGNGTGVVTFYLNNIPYARAYSPGYIDTGDNYNIPIEVNNPDEPNDDNFFCFRNLAEDGKTIKVIIQ